MIFMTTHEIKFFFGQRKKKKKQDLEIKEFTWSSQPFKANTLQSGQMIEVVLSSVFRNHQ